MQNLRFHFEVPVLAVIFLLPATQVNVFFNPAMFLFHVKNAADPTSAAFIYVLSHIQFSAVFGGFHGSLSSVQDGHTSLRKQDEQEGLLA
jgi:hypothetical protein